MRIVIAVGGNALLPRGGRLDAEVQLRHLDQIGPDLALLAREHQLVVVHGNGPQVGLLALESSADRSLSVPYPLDDLVAETQGMIGYWLQQTIANHGGGEAVTLISQTVVSADDPAFAEPTKFIGPAYDRGRAESLAAQNGWQVRADGDVWRRVVPSPQPREIVELEIVEQILDAGATVIVAGGGGVPVLRVDDRLTGVEAVVDKDLAAGLLAERLGADLFVVVTDVPAVMRDFGSPGAEPVGATTPDALDEVTFPEGSMGPKVRAVSRFVRGAGRRAAIGSLQNLADVVGGTSGTQVSPVQRPELVVLR